MVIQTFMYVTSGFSLLTCINGRIKKNYGRLDQYRPGSQVCDSAETGSLKATIKGKMAACAFSQDALPMSIENY